MLNPKSELIITGSGIRGIFNQSLKVIDAVRVSEIFSSLIGDGEIVVGRDTRPSGSPLSEAILAALTALGRDVVDVGVAPTPSIIHAVRTLNAAGGVVISASHNPPEWNGLKLVGTGGLLLDEEWYQKVKEQLRLGERRVTYKAEIGRRTNWNPLASHINAILDHVKVDRSRSGRIKVALDCGGGAGSLVTPRLLRSLGCKVTTIHCNSDGYFPRPLDPTSNALNDLSRFVTATESDVGFAHDCDADRFVCVAEDGSVLRPDEGLAIIIDDFLKETKERIVVTNIASSLIIDDVAEKYGAKVVRTPVGEAYVVQEIIRRKAKIGGEGSSGGLIIPEVNYTRDGPLACAKVVEVLSKRDVSISELLRSFPKYYYERMDVECPKSALETVFRRIAEKHKDKELDYTDGLKVIGEKEWLLIRASRTEPKVRILAEAESPMRAKRLCENAVEEIGKAIHEVESSKA